MTMKEFVSRAGQKLEVALKEISLPVEGAICADLGCSTGGFTHCLLERGAARVYAVDTGYGVLDWKLRNDERVVVRERTNALHVELPEVMDIISIDAGWTKQDKILPKALELVKEGGYICTLLKPHYESYEEEREKGRVKDECLSTVMDRIHGYIATLPVTVLGEVESPVTGGKGGNIEFMCILQKQSS